jgi:hypothetical protein
MALEGHANHLDIAQAITYRDDLAQRISMQIVFQAVGTMPDAQAIRFLTTLARSEPVSVRL